MKDSANRNAKERRFGICRPAGERVKKKKRIEEASFLRQGKKRRRSEERREIIRLGQKS